MHVSSKSDSDSHIVADRNSCARGYPGSYCHSHPHRDAGSDPNTYSNSDTYSNAYTNSYPYAARCHSQAPGG